MSMLFSLPLFPLSDPPFFFFFCSCCFAGTLLLPRAGEEEGEAGSVQVYTSCVPVYVCVLFPSFFFFFALR